MKKEILRIENLYVTSNDRRVLKGIYLNLFKGESVALMGLNGSGINLLMDTLCGKEHVESGRIIIDEKSVNLKNEISSRILGIYKISYEQTLIDELSIAENIFVMRRNSLKNIFLDRKMLNIQAHILLKKLGFDISPSTLVSRLTPAQKQLVELAKAVGSGAKIILFDENFEFYRDNERIRLKKIVDNLMKEGLSFIFISQHVEEIKLFSDKIIIFKEGNISKKMETSQFDEKMTADYVVGYSLSKREPLEIQELGDVALEVEKISSGKGKSGFSVKYGEVVSLTDIYSKDKEKLIHALRGYHSGYIVRIDGVDLNRRTNKNLGNKKVVFIQNPIKTDILFRNMSIGDNLLIPSIKKVRGIVGFVDKKIASTLETQFFTEIEHSYNSVDDLDINNKILLYLESWLVYRPKIVIMMDPFLQADVVDSELISEYIRKFAKMGTAVIILSSRPDKLIDCSNRIISIEGLFDDLYSQDRESKGKRIAFQKPILRNISEKLLKYYIALFIIFGYIGMTHNYINYENTMILLRQFAIFGFAVLGVYLITLCDNVILSAGSQVALASVVVVAFTVYGNFPIWTSILISFIVAAILGIIYAKFTIKTRVPIVFFSFAMMYILNGLNSIIVNSYSGGIINGLSFLAYGELLNIPVSLLLFILTLAMTGFLLKYTFFGKSIYIIGANKDEAKKSGLPVDFVKVIVYVLGFLIMNVTGVLFLARTSMSSDTYGNNYFYDIVAALCIGRISLFGGKGSITGVILGTLSIVLLESFFTVTMINGVSQEMIKGFIITAILIKEHFSKKQNLHIAR